MFEPVFKKSRFATQFGLFDRGFGIAYSLLLLTEWQFGLLLLFDSDLERDLVLRDRV